MSKYAALSNGEWKIMNILWEKSPITIAEIVSALRDDTAWTKATVFMMLSRMGKKGAVRFEEGGRSKFFYPVWNKENSAINETESFLSRVYGGSLKLMLSSMTDQKSLTKEDIDELYSILKKAEEEARK
ncbi:MAG: BlaI/MecI/CopY family transcriptional regulator [Lachnospiraceae bacterium]|nr:BlaI/MecI/CopY family transcriptional regulator [Lachnospiraceae bacterium]